MAYTPWSWANGQIITAERLNYIEDGIAALDNDLTTIHNINDTIDTINAQLASLNNMSDEIQTSVYNYINGTLMPSVITTLNNKQEEINTTLSQVISDSQTALSTLNTQVENYSGTITDLIKSLYGSSATAAPTNSSDHIYTKISNLESDTTDLRNALGATYYAVGWSSDNTKSDIDTRITEIYDSVFGSSGTGSSTSIAQQISALNDAIFGASGSSSGASLIDKIEGAMGRSLDLEQNETADQQTGVYSKSLKTLIQELQGVLGIEGGTAGAGNSNLVDNVNTVLDLLYGYTVTPSVEPGGEAIITRKSAPTLENFLDVNGYLTLHDDFYNIQATGEVIDSQTGQTSSATLTKSAVEWIAYLTSKMSSVIASNAAINASFEQSQAAITRSLDAYIAAELDDSDASINYLVLKRDISDTSLDTRIPLPAGGGGGGGAVYEHTARFEVVTPPENTTINIGDNCNITFIWQLFDDNDNEVSGLAGTLTLKINNIAYMTRTISSGVPVTINMGDYITATGRNTVAFVVSTDTALTKTLYQAITAYNAILTSTFNQETIQTGSTISFPYIAAIGSSTISKTLHILVDGVEQVLSNNITAIEQQNTVTFATPASGDHLIQAYFTAQIDEDLTIESNMLNYGIICGTSTAARISTNFINGTEVEQYSNLQINYRVITVNQETSPINIYVNDNLVYSANVPSTYRTWSYQVLQAGGTTLTIRLVSGTTEKVLTAEVIQNTNVPAGAFDLVSSGLQLYLTADLRSNDEQHPEIWTNSSTQGGAPDVNVELNNFLFYNTIDGWQQDEDGAYFLRLRNQAKVVINYPLFSFDMVNNVITSGLTFEIDFRTEDVADSAALICQCFEGAVLNTNVENKYITLTAQKALFNNTKTLETQYKEEEKITMAFVVNPGNLNTKANRLIYIYMNGVLSGAIPYESSANLNFNNTDINTTTAKIILGSPECTLDIYSLKVYNRALTYQEIIKNWINGTTNFSERVNRYLRNDYSSGFSIANFTANSPTTPYMIITGDGPLDGDGAYMPQQKGSANKKSINVRYVDPVNPNNSFSAISLYTEGDEDENYTGAAEVQVQGTSSQAYYRKNYKIKLSSFTYTQSGEFHIKKPGDKYYDITYETQNEGTEEETQIEVSRVLKSGISKEGYKLRSTSYPTYTFCIKADVASSESVNNTGLVQLYDSAIRKVTLTPPQYDDARIRQGVEGYPMVVWYINGQTNEETLLGRYNFNNDKGTHEVYGLKTDLSVDKTFNLSEFNKPNGIFDESWEVKNNNSDSSYLVQFEVAGAPNSQERENIWYAPVYNSQNELTYKMNWQQSFESRFPDQDDEGIATIGLDDTVNNVNYVKKRLAGLREMVEWVNDTVVWEDGNKNSITSESCDAFKAGFQNYFNLNAMLFFYVFTELFLMVDNRAKNMFWTRYQYRSGIRPTSAGYNYLTNTLAPDNNNYYGWFTFPYDFDTAIGTNNQGKNVYDYHWESLDVNGPTGESIFGGQHSKLWVAFRQAYPDLIANTYINMRNDINYTTVETLFENNQSIWSETVTNEDMIVKYINWGNATGYDMLLGLKDMQRKWWLYNRFKYFNSKFAIERATDRINIRIHVNNANIPVQVYADSYVSVSVGADSATPQATVRVLRGETGYLSVGSGDAAAVDSSGIETFISPASSLKSIMNLSTFGLSSADLSSAIRLQSLQIGTPNPANVNTRFSNFQMAPKDAQGNSLTPLLRHLDLRNCVALTGNLGLADCLFLNRVYLTGTSLSSVSLPNGGVLETIQYPTSITTILIQNQPYLKHICIGSTLPAAEIEQDEIEYTTAYTAGANDYSNVESIYLSNTGNVIDTLEMVQEMENTGYLHIEDVLWTMSGTDFYALWPKINNLHGFIGTQNDDNEKSVITGKLRLTSSLPSELTLSTIATRFPHLSIVLVTIEDGQEVEHPYYTVNFYNFSNRIIETQIVASGGAARDNSATLIANGDIELIVAENGKTRQGFGGWNTSLSNIQSNLEIYPVPITEYAVHFTIDNQDAETNTPNPMTTVRYYALGNQIDIQSQTLPQFVRDYKDYIHVGWLDEDENVFTIMPSVAPTDVIYLHGDYRTSPHTYIIKILNTNADGIPDTDNPIAIIRGIVAGTGSKNENGVDLKSYITGNELAALLTDDIAMIDSNEENQPWGTRRHRFLNWSPYVGTSAVDYYNITGDANIKLLYYDVQDYFTNYFINKLTICDLTDSVNGQNITQLPVGSFLHNSNLTRLECYVTHIGQYSFSNFITSTETPRIFYFKSSSDITLDRAVFRDINNAIVVFETTGQITMGRECFSRAQNCTIVIQQTNLPIRGEADFTDFFNNANNNAMYVTSTACDAYRNKTETDNYPVGLSGNYAGLLTTSIWSESGE